MEKYIHIYYIRLNIKEKKMYEWNIYILAILIDFAQSLFDCDMPPLSVQNRSTLTRVDFLEYALVTLLCLLLLSLNKSYVFKRIIVYFIIYFPFTVYNIFTGMKLYNNKCLLVLSYTTQSENNIIQHSRTRPLYKTVKTQLS